MEPVMQRIEVKIGDMFRCGGKRWKVTDIGTRTVIAIPIKEGWMEGAALYPGRNSIR